MAKNDLMTYALIGAGVLAGIYVYNKSKPKTSEYTTETTSSFIPDATPSIIKSDIRQSGRSERVGLRQSERTKRVQARQSIKDIKSQDRTSRAFGRQETRKEKTELRQSGRTERLSLRLKARAERQERRIQERKETRKAIATALSNLREKFKRRK